MFLTFEQFSFNCLFQTSFEVKHENNGIVHKKENTLLVNSFAHGIHNGKKLYPERCTSNAN